MAAETTKEVFEVVGETMGLYNKVLDEVIPWKEFEATLSELDRYHDDYSKESAELLDQIKAYMVDGMDAYHRSSKSIYDWTGTTLPILTQYLDLFDKNSENDAKTAKKLLVDMLDDGIKSMTHAQKELASCSAHFNQASGKLVSLNTRLGIDFDKESNYYASQVSDIRLKAYIGAAILGPFGLLIAAGIVEGKVVPDLDAKLADIKKFYEEVKDKVVRTQDDIDNVKVKLNEEIRVIGDLKIQTETAEIFVGLNDELKTFIVESVEGLISKCNEFRLKHIQ